MKTMKKERQPNISLTQLLTQPQEHKVTLIEQKVLGFLLDPDWGGPSAVNYVLAYGITPEDFYYTEHQRLFRVLVELTKRNIQFNKEFDITNPYPTIIHLYEKLFSSSEPLPEATTAGLQQYLLHLQGQVVSHDVFFDQVKTLKQSAYDRKLLETLARVIYHYQQTGEWDGALNQIAQVMLPTLNVQIERVLNLEELSQIPAATDFIWEPFLRTDGIALLVGPAGVGKSLLALWIALQICQGNPLFEFKTYPVTVLYVDAETNEIVTKSRITKLTNITSANFFYVPFGGDLFNLANYAAFVHYLQQTQPGLVILDSLIRFHTLDENKASDMKQLAIFFRELTARFNCAFLLLHHTRKTSQFGTISDVVRGSTELRAFPDTVLILKRARGSNDMVVDIDKCRDSHELNQARFKIRLNTSQDLWTYEFLGFTEETETKIEDAMKLITQLLETEPLPRKEIITRLRNEGISKQTTERALAELKSLGKVISQRVGRQTIYSIPKETGQQNLL
jgi:hypothetical protein